MPATNQRARPTTITAPSRQRRARAKPGIPGTLLRIILPVAVCAASAVSGQEGVATGIRDRLATLETRDTIRLAGALVASSAPLLDLYARRHHGPVWTDDEAVAGLERSIRDAALDGLDPADYHLAAIRALESASGPAAAADRDILLSYALLRLAHDLRYGKVRANDPGAGRDLSRPVTGEDPADDVLRIVETGRIERELRALRPSHFIYRGLVAALADLRRIRSLDAREPVPGGPLIRPGDADPRVPALRRRLRLLGDLPVDAPAPIDSTRVDDELASSIRRFQRRHALNQDGVVGPATLREINVPIDRRIDQVRVNLDRARWLTPDLPGTFVVVNIAGAMAYTIRDGSVSMESRAIVGRIGSSTPVFQATLEYVDLNPTWTVPPGIVAEILESVRRDPTYLRRNGIRVIDASGREVAMTPEEIALHTSSTFPYYFRQAPGPLNPLGRIKLMFPNPHDVYLHDTPERGLFDRDNRTFSHGCVRLQDPVGMAAEVLDDPRWTREALEAAIRTGETRTIRLARPLPVLVYYWTAATDETGELHFYRDAYGRDPAVLSALDAP